MKSHTSLFQRSLVIAAVTIALSACSSDEKKYEVVTPIPVTPPSPPVAPAPLPSFDEDGVLEANIRWTEYGVPHVTAQNLESMSFGVGYAFAQDNLCILADQIIKYNSQRAKYLGPDRNLGSGDSEHLINDFGFLTLGIREQAEQNLASMSANSRALVSGYAQGYNQYLNETGSANIDPSCAGQPWVQEIDSIDILTYSLGVALLPGAANFLGPMFLAAPPGENPLPIPVVSAMADSAGNSSLSTIPFKMQPNVPLPQINPQDMGSNGWGLGVDKTENGMGMVLGNPHFPHTGNLRFWQFHTTIPGHLNVMGGSLMGLPGAVNIGFNENVAWTHTFSTAEHFVVYQLQLDGSDDAGLTHSVDGNKRTIFKKELIIDVAVGPGQTIQLKKNSFSTNYGPMIVVPGNFEWGPGDSAFAIKDANSPNYDVLDHWLAMNLAGDMNEFKQAFKDYDGVIFNNTMAASKSGEVFYIDDSTVPGLTATALNALATNPLLIQTKAVAGFTVLPGFASAFDFNQAVPYESAPKYEGTDYVQNSNDSFWLTNFENPITGVSPLYGQVGNQQSLRSRMAHKLLADAAGSDGKFNMMEVEEALLGNRNYLGEAILSELLAICQANREIAVDVNGQMVNIADGCDALAAWDSTMNIDSVGAHVFREFAFQFRLSPQWAVAYDVTDVLNTPRGLLDNETTLMQLATAIDKLLRAEIELDAVLGEVQFVEKSTATGLASGERLPWGGAHNVEGGFNVYDTSTSNNGTELARHTYPAMDNTTRLSTESKGYHITSGSSWMFIANFTENGPVARGLLTYSQSHNPESEQSDDQSKLYSTQPQLRPLYFTDADITANLVKEKNVTNAVQQ
ncbi:MAG: acyl-homoserine-lactone acylase [Granulosicoccus sp.]|jgi:acyl-homoserine-lactone acylase